MIDMPRILARERDGTWHVARATYPSHADTACGRTVEANLFSTEGNPEIFEGRRWTRCDACFGPEGAP